MIGGRYSREREIGRGGMGAVWLGRDEVLGRPVAIKLVGMMPGGSSADLLRAEREARIAASLNHPHVVGIYDLVHDDDQQWLVMEFFAGTTLGDVIRREGRLSPEQLAPILVQAAQALAAAHQAGIVHRDVKPSNILVREDGAAKISDFGIARARADESLTQTGLVTGSPAYLAPEVASGHTALPASDVWSLGATAFHALAGHPPYDVGDNVLGALYRIVNEAPPRLYDAGELGPLLLATMVHRPESRWSMADIVGFLESFTAGSRSRTAEPVIVEHEPAIEAPTQVLAAPPTPARTPPRPVQIAEPPVRRRVLPVVVAAVVVALVVSIVLLALTDDPQRHLGVAGAGEGTQSSTSPTSSTPPTSSTSPTAPASTKQEMERFVTDYIATASTEPEAGFRQLTTDYQAQSNGLDGYESFWGNVTNARISRIDADPAALTVIYTYSYSYNGRGAGRYTETVTLQLEQTDDGFLIAGQA